LQFCSLVSVVGEIFTGNHLKAAQAGAVIELDEGESPLDSRLVRTQPMTVKVEPISSETRTLETRVLFKSTRFLLKVSHERNKIFHGVDAVAL